MSAADVIERSTIDDAELEALEAVVKVGLASFMAVGLALMEIRETRGYRLRGYKTFDVYCKATFGFSGKQGRRLKREASTALWAKTLTGEDINAGNARNLSPILGKDIKLIGIQAKLQARGMSLADAPGAAIIALMPRAKKRTRGIVDSKSRPLVYGPRQTGADICPGHGGRPTRYFYREAEGGWLCSVCSTVVKLSVSR